MPTSRTLSILLAIALAGAVGYALGRAPSDSAGTHPVAIVPPSQADPLPMELPMEEDPHAGQGMSPHGSGGGTEPASEGEELPGVVIEYQDVSQYTYLHLATEAGDTWAAVYRTPVKKGQRVTVQSAIRLEGFKSKELNREFPVIYFGTLPGAEVAPKLDAGAAHGTQL